MIVRPEHAEAVERAREHGRTCAMKAHTAGLEPSFVGHAYLAEAMKMFFNCDNARALELASGLMVLAYADQNSDAADGTVLADYVLTRAVNEPEIVDRFRALSGLIASAPQAVTTPALHPE